MSAAEPIRAAYRLDTMPLSWFERFVIGAYDGVMTWGSTIRLIEQEHAFIGARGNISFILAHPSWWAASRAPSSRPCF